MMSNAILMALVPVFFVLLLGYAAGKFHIVDNLHVDALNALVMDFARAGVSVRGDRVGVAPRDDRAGSALPGARRDDAAALSGLVFYRARGLQGLPVGSIVTGVDDWLSESRRRWPSDHDFRRGVGRHCSGCRRIGGGLDPHQSADPDHGGNGRRQGSRRANGGAAGLDRNSACDHQAGGARARARHPVLVVGCEPRRAGPCEPRADRKFGCRRRPVSHRSHSVGAVVSAGLEDRRCNGGLGHRAPAAGSCAHLSSFRSRRMRRKRLFCSPRRPRASSESCSPSTTGWIPQGRGRWSSPAPDSAS